MDILFEQLNVFPRIELLHKQPGQNRMGMNEAFGFQSAGRFYSSRRTSTTTGIDLHNISLVRTSLPYDDTNNLAKTLQHRAFPAADDSRLEDKSREK